jgi:hypothetical protein
MNFSSYLLLLTQHFAPPTIGNQNWNQCVEPWEERSMHKGEYHGPSADDYDACRSRPSIP